MSLASLVFQSYSKPDSMLKAQYKFRLSSPLHVATAVMLNIQPDEPVGKKLAEEDVFRTPDQMKFEFSVDDFIVSLQLHQDLVNNPLSLKHHWIGCQTVTVSLSNDKVGEQGLDEAHWVATATAFSKVAFQTVNRLVDYCRYELGYPFLRPVNASSVESVVWMDSDAQVLKTEGDYHIYGFFPGIPGNSKSLGSRFLTPHHSTEIVAALVCGATPNVHQELLAFARDAIYERHTLKAVLLLAISSEVAIKTTFFREETLASIAFDYLEENRRVEVTSIELIGKVAKRAFGTSFSEHNPTAATSVDHLFRCRNKVAHRARAEYKDDKGVLHTADEATLYAWWSAVDLLHSWLAHNADMQHRRQSKG